MEPMACPHCEEGFIEVQTCNHSGVCPCAGVEVPCEECDGTGFVKCGICGDNPAVEGLPEPCCTECAWEGYGIELPQAA